MEKILNTIEDFFSEYPEYCFLVIGIISLVFFIGILKNKSWAIDPDNSTQKFQYELFGHKAFRLYAGFAYFVGTAVSDHNIIHN